MAFLLEVSKPTGTVFSAKTIYDSLAQTLTADQLKIAVQKKVPSMFRTFKRLKVIHGSGCFENTQRNGQALCQKWIVGKAPANGQLSSDTKFPDTEKTDPRAGFSGQGSK